MQKTSFKIDGPLLVYTQKKVQNCHWGGTLSKGLKYYIVQFGGKIRYKDASDSFAPFFVSVHLECIHADSHLSFLIITSSYKLESCFLWRVFTSKFHLITWCMSLHYLQKADTFCSTRHNSGFKNAFEALCGILVLNEPSILCGCSPLK